MALDCRAWVVCGMVPQVETQLVKGEHVALILITNESTLPYSGTFGKGQQGRINFFFVDDLLRARVIYDAAGKTQLVKGKLAGLGEDTMALPISFNYFTDVNSFQNILESSLEKKVGDENL